MKKRLFNFLIAVGLLVGMVYMPGSNSLAQSNPLAVPKFLFFAADGLRQDLLMKYSRDGQFPLKGRLAGTASLAADGGLLTQAPPNTGAGWFSLATGAWSAVHGSTNNTFHKNGADFASRTAAFDPGVLQAETLAQSAERGGKKVAQIEWAGGRSAVIDGPTVDYRSFLSGRGVVTNYIDPNDLPNFIASFGLQFDHPDGFAGQAAFPEAAPSPASGWVNVPASYSPAMEVRMRVLDFGTDKYGLNVYLFDSTDDGTVNYDMALFSPSKDGAEAVAVLGEGEWGEVKVTIIGGALEGKTGGYLIKVERLSEDLSQVRLFHTSVTRAIASWPGWPGEPGFSGDFEDFIAEQFPVSTAADFAVLEAGIVSEETYVEQGLYWETLYHPLIEYIVNTYQPDLVMAGYPVTDEFQHQFLGLITPNLPTGEPNPAYDDVQVNGTPDGRVKEREGFIRRAYMGAMNTVSLIHSLLGTKTTTFVAADHGFAPQFLAIDASKVLVDLGLLSHPQTSNCRPATGETIGKAKACWAGGTVQIFLNLEGRDPAGAFQQVAAADAEATVQMIKAAFEALSDPNDWTGDGQPESWTVIDRVFTKAETRYIPNGPGSFADMAHPTRTGDVVAFSYPPYQFDAATPGTLIALSAFFGQHGYVPDVVNLEANITMRAGFIAFGQGINSGMSVQARTIDLAPTAAFLLGVPTPQHSQGRVLLELIRGSHKLSALTVIGLTDYHGQLEPTTLPVDGINVQVGGAAYLATLFDEELAHFIQYDEETPKPPDTALLLASGDNVGASPPNSALLEDVPTIDVLNAWGLDATAYGNHEFDYGLDRLLMHQDRANFPFLAVNIKDEATGRAPEWVQSSKLFTLNGIKVGVIGAALENTPELVAAGNTEGLLFLPAAEEIRKESRKLQGMGAQVQIVVIHEGTSIGSNAVDGMPPSPWEGPVIDIAEMLQDTTIDVILAGHTHRISNLMVGNILVGQGLNAGASYSVVQLVTAGAGKNHDVIWAGGSTRVAKILGVDAREDVQAIVDAANDETAVLRNQVIGTQQSDILRDPARLNESAMGNLVADAMWDKYPGIDAAYTNSGGLRADLVCSPPSAGEAACEITWGEVFAVLPFGNRTTILTLDYASLEAAFINGFSPVCDTSVHSGRFPQIAGLRVQFHCDGTAPVIDAIWRTPEGIGGPEILLGPGDSVRLVTNDFMYTGGDGYTMFSAGTDVLQPGDDLMTLVVDYITANSPISSAIEDRIIGDAAGTQAAAPGGLLQLVQRLFLPAMNP